MARTNWQMGDTVQPEDLNQLGQEINDNAADLADHKSAAVLDHPDGSVTTEKLADGAVTAAKVAADVAKVTDLTAHTNTTSGVHGATSEVTANRIVQRDSAGRAKFAAPAASDDAARKAEVDAVQTNLANHIADYVRQPGYAAATGSANTYTVNLNPAPTAYNDGMAIAVKINVDNTGASTINVNGLGSKTIKKPNGNDVSAGTLKAGSIYTLRYNDTTGNFILQGEGGSGSAQPSEVLSGKTFTNDIGEQTGIMPNRGNVNQTLASQGQEYTIPQGYHGGSGKVTANITNLSAANIKAGVTVGGVAGTFTNDATATAAQILSGQTAYVNGSKVTGTMANRTGHVTGQSVSHNGTTIRIRPQAGFYPGDSGNSVQVSDTNFIAANIRSGVSIFGLTGTLVEGKRWASGIVQSTSTGVSGFEMGNGTAFTAAAIEVNGLSFKPRVIICREINTPYSSGALTLYIEYNLSQISGYVSQGHVGKYHYGHQTGETIRGFRVTSGAAYVNETGFRLPALNSNILYEWFAWE